MTKALSPKTTLGLTEVPSPGAAEVGIALVTVLLDVALDLVRAFVAGLFFLSLGGGMDLFFLASTAYLPFFKGEMSGISSRGCFLLMTMPFAPIGVSPFGPPLPLVI